MKKRAFKKLVDICECGHYLDEHEICDCHNCPDQVHECYAKIKQGNNNDFCECQDYNPAKKRNKK